MKFLREMTPAHGGCTPFDPLVDTERHGATSLPRAVFFVAPPSIRLWILKEHFGEGGGARRLSCTPFDPLVDTESQIQPVLPLDSAKLHPLRSACGY